MVGVIADDLSGAAELGAVGQCCGLGAEVVSGGDPSRKADLVCLDTDSRSCLPDEAGRRAALAASALVAAGAKWIYKKVDSVLRGPILAELEAILKQLRLPHALLVPANPAAGRTIRHGRYLILGKPIHQSDFRLDPEYPCRTSLVREMLGDGSGRLLQVCTVEEPLPTAGIALGEAVSPGDLRHWARRLNGATLPAGAAEFFAAVLEARGHPPAKSPCGGSGLVPQHQHELFVCGSTSQATRDFVAKARQQDVPVFCLPARLAKETSMTETERDSLAARVGSAWRSNPRVILEIGLAPVRVATIARGLADRLAELAQAVLHGMGNVHVYAEGGATAASLARRMGWQRLKVARQLAPGVVTLQVAAGSKCLLTIKPGSYPWPVGTRSQIRG